MSWQFTIAQKADVSPTGAALRYFMFPNPAEIIAPVPKELEYSLLKPLAGQVIRQRPQASAQEFQLIWPNTPSGLYMNLRTFAQRNASFDIPTSYLYDGDVGNFPVLDTGGSLALGTGQAVHSGTPVKVLDVIGVPLREFLTTGTPSASSPYVIPIFHRMKVVMKFMRAI